MKIKLTRPDFIFQFFLYGFMLIVCFTMLYPFWYLLINSLSVKLNANYSLIPKEISFDNYFRVFANPFILTGYKSTLTRVILGTALTLVFTIATAYPLSKKYFPDRTFWTGYMVFTMFFGGGLIPTFLLIRSLGITDTIWALVLPGLILTYSMLIMRNFFMSIPAELEESARMDGANDIVILIRIIIPVSTPIIATITLWSMVGHWNSWFDSMIYIRTPARHVLQQVLRRIVLEGSTQFWEAMGDIDPNLAVITNTESIKAATIMVATIPILCVYPFLQKYFVKGIMVGSLKG